MHQRYRKISIYHFHLESTFGYIIYGLKLHTEQIYVESIVQNCADLGLYNTLLGNTELISSLRGDNEGYDEDTRCERAVTLSCYIIPFFFFFFEGKGVGHPDILSPAFSCPYLTQRTCVRILGIRFPGGWGHKCRSTLPLQQLPRLSVCPNSRSQNHCPNVHVYHHSSSSSMIALSFDIDAGFVRKVSTPLVKALCLASALATPVSAITVHRFQRFFSSKTRIVSVAVKPSMMGIEISMIIKANDEGAAA